MAPFPYHRSVAPMVGVLLGLSVIEMLVVDTLVGFWNPRLGLVLTIAALAGIVSLVLLLRSFRRLPVLVGEGRVVMRAGFLRQIKVPAGAIAGLRADWTAETLKERGVVRLSLLAYPNVMLDIDPPIVTRRGLTIRAIAHRLDDPAAFSAAVAALRPGDG